MFLLLMYCSVLIINAITCFRAINKKDNLTWCCCLATLCFIALDILLTIKIR